MTISLAAAAAAAAAVSAKVQIDLSFSQDRKIMVTLIKWSSLQKVWVNLSQKR
jgi:hypothetical protein